MGRDEGRAQDSGRRRRFFVRASILLGLADVSLEGKVGDSTELARQGHLMHDATESLTSLRDPQDVIAEATVAMWKLAGPGFRGASYLRVSDGVVTQVAVADDRGSDPTSYLLKDDPYVKTVVASGQALVAALDRTAMGASLRAVTDETQSTDAALIPVTVNEELHGMFQIDSRGIVVSEDLLVCCRSFANVVELALANAIAHHEFEIQANTDPLTGLANRRGLSLFLEGDRRGNAKSILVLDIDQLEAINDAQGHKVGDKVLVAVARAAAGVLRAGDLLARTGGDEFLAVVADADESAARRVADRMTEAVSHVQVQGVRTSVSIGHASCGKNGDVERLRQQADEAMDEAKQVARRQRGRHPRASDRA
jgi:diguanylate cyclase (GGDEF)-like protein